MRIGIDVGSTNTDAVLMRGREVLGFSKRPTTPEVTSGITDALQSLLDSTAVDVREIRNVMVGTTQFVNAFVERKRLTEVAVVRIAAPLTEGIPPLLDWPDALRQALGNHVYMITGGCYYTGEEYIPLDERALLAAARDIKKNGLKSIALTSIFAPVRPDIEERAASVIRSVIPDVAISLSAQLGSLNLIERENATVINASLYDLAAQVITSFRQSLQALNIEADLYVTQNDGALMRADFAGRYPVMTCSAGPTNSIRGAGFLSGREEAVVIDIGGTTTDIGFLVHGFPRETVEANEIGGVRTNFSMPDVLSIGLGGGSIVCSEAGLSVGPHSVGYRLPEEARIFGGSTLTATDIAVAAGQCALGDKSGLGDVPRDTVTACMELIHRMVETGIDRMKTSARAVPAILVGGGHILVSRTPKGVSSLHRPEHAAVANAIGAAMGQVGARIKRIVDYSEQGREATIASVSDEVRRLVLERGGRNGTVRIVDIEEMPMTHMQNNAVSLKIKGIGDLDIED